MKNLSGRLGMTSSAFDVKAFAMGIEMSNEALTVHLTDGRSVSVPIEWYPRLFHATPSEIANWTMIGNGEGINWPSIDEDISISSIMEGIPSCENSNSLQRWLKNRS